MSASLHAINVAVPHTVAPSSEQRLLAHWLLLLGFLSHSRVTTRPDPGRPPGEQEEEDSRARTTIAIGAINVLAPIHVGHIYTRYKLAAATSTQLLPFHARERRGET
ncbi:hypothetical protein GUJ93_ZPchr0003g16920 [Zizania palustris]|uniref:Uncharacterized protein n=1 Tax=Zizania palustris TaxID=103762 RepID=A0A8J5VJC6_ZIZPA|nr:hypothetical protein GUJ93_ZPchr0003g16920 [Zizania palustris]